METEPIAELGCRNCGISLCPPFCCCCFDATPCLLLPFRCFNDLLCCFIEEQNKQKKKKRQREGVVEKRIYIPYPVEKQNEQEWEKYRWRMNTARGRN